MSDFLLRCVRVSPNNRMIYKRGTSCETLNLFMSFLLRVRPRDIVKKNALVTTGMPPRYPSSHTTRRVYCLILHLRDEESGSQTKRVCVCVCVCVSQGGGLSKCRFWIFPKKAPFPFNYELNKPPRKHFSTKSFFY